MQENRKESTRVFLGVNEMKRLIDLGMDTSDAQYMWSWYERIDEYPNEGQLYSVMHEPTYECHTKVPTYCFHELLKKLPKWIDMPAPGYLINCYHDTPIGKNESGEDLYRHFLNLEISVDGMLRIGYRNEYFESVSPRYPFPECPENPDDQYLAMNLPGGLIDKDWLKVVYDLIIKLLEDGICKSL